MSEIKYAYLILNSAIALFYTLAKKAIFSPIFPSVLTSGSIQIYFIFKHKLLHSIQYEITIIYSVTTKNSVRKNCTRHKL